MSYPDPYNSSGPRWEATLVDPPLCPVCDFPVGQCQQGSWEQHVTLPPVDLDPEPDRGGPLRMYRVALFGYSTVMKLNDADAGAYGDAAVPVE